MRKKIGFYNCLCQFVERNTCCNRRLNCVISMSLAGRDLVISRCIAMEMHQSHIELGTNSKKNLPPLAFEDIMSCSWIDRFQLMDGHGYKAKVKISRFSLINCNCQYLIFITKLRSIVFHLLIKLCGQ